MEPPLDEYIERPPEGVRAGLGAARRPARPPHSKPSWVTNLVFR